MVLGIYGASGLGREVLELAGIINDRNRRWDEFIFIDDGTYNDLVNGVAVYSYSDAMEKYSDSLEVVLGIGEPETRGKLFKKLEDDGIRTPTLIHPDVHIPETTVIGKGVVIQYGCFISCNVTIEDYVYIQPQVNVGHDDVLQKGCMLSAFVNLGGIVNIGRNAFIGLSTSVKQITNIGDYAVVSMGSAVYKDIPAEMIAMGNPARPMRKNEEHRVFK